jgi:large subunit ribosomal protein L13
MKYTIDAKGKKLGRLATEIAVLLIGKNLPTFKRNEAPDVQVVVSNASQIALTETKKDSKEYKFYSGYPGGLRFEKLSTTIDKKGYADVLRRTVDGMLPKNKLRSRMIKNLTISE